MSPSRSGPFDDERVCPESSEITKVSAGPSMPQGLGRGVSLEPSGLELGRGKGFGAGPAIGTGLSVLGIKEYGVDIVDRKKGCTRRVLVEGGDLGGSSCLRQPFVKGGESIL